MTFNWLRFLDSTRTPYLLGPCPNVRRDHVGINCPVCRSDDKYYFSIDIEEGKIRGCWWSANHWRNPTELIAILAGVTFAEANKIYRGDDDAPKESIADMRKRLEALDDPKGLQVHRVILKVLDLPPEFNHFTSEPSRRERPFVRYLHRRGFGDVQHLGAKYGLRWCDLGEWGPRVIFPLYRLNRILGWTARAITPARAKYLHHPEGDTIRHLLWTSPNLDRAEVVVVCEGVLDALRVVTCAPREKNVGAVALLGLSAGEDKLAALREVARHKRVVFLLDRGTEAQAMELRGRTPDLNARIGFLPEGVKDPGDLSEWQVEELVSDF